MDWPDPVNDKVGNIMLSRIMGAEVRLDPAGFGIGFKDAGSGRWRTSRARWYAVRHPGRASDHRLGGLGFARWAEEVAEQESELGVFFDTIVVCSVTGSTHAGMIAGFAGQDRPRRVIGIDASAKIAGDARAGRADRPEHRRADRARPRPPRPTRSPSSRAGPATSTASPSSRRSTQSGSPASSRA